MKGLFLLLLIPPFLGATCGAIFIVFWVSKVSVGILNLDQTLLVAVACFVASLLYLVSLGGVLAHRRCALRNEHEELEELVEQ